jgi:hypothetical protein
MSFQYSFLMWQQDGINRHFILQLHNIIQVTFSTLTSLTHWLKLMQYEFHSNTNIVSANGCLCLLNHFIYLFHNSIPWEFSDHYTGWKDMRCRRRRQHHHHHHHHHILIVTVFLILLLLLYFMEKVVLPVMSSSIHILFGLPRRLYSLGLGYFNAYLGILLSSFIVFFYINIQFIVLHCLFPKTL